MLYNQSCVCWGNIQAATLYLEQNPTDFNLEASQQQPSHWF